MMDSDENVLYVYRCAACGHRGEVHFADDSHDCQHVLACDPCGAAVALEWDGGVKLVTKKATPRG